ncbi:hypothetical protein BGZ83_005564 [Gryganskiella cystojenkinii]|nr:hypothetical protein BGZ83_005564 [Gryganskiella cystojenkinii]
MSTFHNQSSLEVTIHSAHDLDDVERVGKNDAYARISLDYTNSHSFQKTSTHKNGGSNPKWDQTLTLKGVNADDHSLYLEILDAEVGVDAPIAFAEIPLQQVAKSPNHTFQGKFEVYTPNGKTKGDVSLTIRILQPGQEPQGQVTWEGSERTGTSRIDDGHQKRMKSLKNLERAADVGQGALAGLAAVGAGFLMNKHHNDEEKKKAELKNAERELA